MTVLAIDTASPVFALAVDAAGGPAIVTAGAAAARPAGLLDAIDALLAGRAPLDALVVVVGPGSYAGIRTGIATAEALAFACGARTIGITTLEALAEAAGPGQHVLVHPAGRGEWWLQEAWDGQLTGQPSLVTAEILIGRPVSGEGASAFGGREVDPGQRVAGALRAGLRRLVVGESGPLQPLYGREPHITQAKRRAPQGRTLEEPNHVR